MSPRTFLSLLLVFGLCLGSRAQDSALIIGRYKQMLEKNPGEGVALDRIWKLYQEKSATGQLLAEYRQKADQKDFSATLILGWLLVKAGETPEARAAFQQAVALNPQSPLPHLALAGILSAQPSPKDAAAEYELAAGLMEEKNPALEDVLFKLGSAQASAGEPLKASEAWERVIAIDPENPDLHRKLAENYAANNLPDKAIAHYRYVAEHGGAQQRALALQSMARVYQMKGEPEAAIQSLEKAIALTSPGNWLRGEFQDQLIRQYQRAHKTPELEQRWKKEADENPRDAGVFLQLIELYDRLGEPGKESDVLKKLTVLLPNNADYKIRLARLYVQLNQIDDAAALFDQILKTQPGNADILFARAEIDMQRDAAQAARARIEALLSQHTDDDSLRGKAIDFYTRHRLFDAVEEHLKSARDENSTLALATFYFSQHRDADAKRTLPLLVVRDDPPEKQAAAHLKVANLLKEQKDSQGALEELKRAAALQPQASEYHLALGDLLSGLNRLEEAQAELEKAFELCKDESARMEADSKLFHVFQMRAPQTGKKSTPPEMEEEFRFVMPPMRRGDMAPPDATNVALQAYLQKMIAAVEKEPTPEGMLRIARWENWCRNSKEAIDFAQRAIALKPDSVTAREALVKIESAVVKPLAIGQLRELVKLNPPKESAYLRQVGRLQMESGDAPGAIGIFSSLSKSKPGDIDVLTDLASALQQVDRWDESLAAWRQAFALAPVSRRKEIGAPLVRVMEHLGQTHEAAETLAKIADAQSDENQRAAAFQDLLVFCTRYELLGWLQDRYEQKLRMNADDYFVEIALSKIMKANGHDAGSFRLLSDATLSAPDQPLALRELVNEAGDRGDFDTAVACQKRLVLLAQQEDSGDLEKLAGLQENNLDLEGAGATWEKIISKFPRNPSALSRAGDYFQRWNDSEKARAVLRRVATLDPAALQVQMALGRLAAGAGDSREALVCYEKILQNAPVENEGEQFRFPGKRAGDATKLEQSYFTALRLRNGQPSTDAMRELRGFWGDEKSPGGQRNLRLEAIGAISGVLKASGDKAAMEAWLVRWPQPSGSPSEALWAFYFSGAGDRVMKLLDGLMKHSPENGRIKQGFVWLALQMGEYEPLRRWLADPARTANERDFFMVCITQMIAGGQGGLDPKLAEGLFPAEYKSRQVMWQVAVQLAARGYFPGAIKLGERVFQTSVTLRPVYGLELAHWLIYTGDIGGARRVLKESIGGEGDSSDATIYVALREYFLLLPENEREAFIDAYSRQVEHSPLHSALSLSLLYGLQGDFDRARQQNSKLIALGPMAYNSGNDITPAYRALSFILTTGVQFQLWKLNPLAVDLWEKTLSDEAAISLQGSQVGEVVREIRLRLFADRLACATGVEADGMLDDYLQSTSPETAATLASLLENNGCNAQSVKVYQRLWRLQPGNPRFYQSLLNACRVANDSATEKSVLKQALGAAPHNPPDAACLQAALQLIYKLTADSEDHAAQKLIEDTARLFPRNRELLAQQAALYGRQRRYDSAEKAYRQLLAMQPNDKGARTALVDLLESAGRIDVAIELLARAGTNSADDNIRLVKLYLRNGQPDKAEHTAWQLLQGRAYDRIPEIATLFMGKGLDKPAREMLLVALGRSKDAATLFQLQSKLLENLPDDAPQALVEKLMHRQRGYAFAEPGLQADPSMHMAYYDLEERLAKKFHREDHLQDGLAAEWRNGYGEPGAGLKLAQILARSGQYEKLKTVCEPLFDRTDFDEQAMNGIQAVLEEAGQYDLLAKGWGSVALKNPIRDEPALHCIQALASSGRKENAVEALEKLGCRYVFNEATAAMVAREYSREGNFEGAAKWFEIAIKRTPDMRNTDVCFDYARMLLDRKDVPGAKRILLIAMRNPAGIDTQVLARYVIESGCAPDRMGSELRNIGLPPVVFADFYSQVILYYQQHGEPLKAIGIGETHPEIISSQRDVPKWLRAAAVTGGLYERGSALFEKVLAQSSDDCEADVAGELALLYRDWKDPLNALDHMKRASELKPEDLEIALSLSGLYLEKSKPAEAAQVLTRFIALSQDQAARDRAKAFLSKIPPG